MTLAGVAAGAGWPPADDAPQAQEDRADAVGQGRDAQGQTALRRSDWTRTLAAYRQPIPARSLFELTVTLVPFVAIWAVAWWLVSISGLLAMALALANAAFLVRLFIIQHDCGHGSLFF